VGAGPELSMFKVMKDGQFMQTEALAPLNALFYAATLGGAKALFQDDRIGNFEPGKEADFLILDLRGKTCMALPNASQQDAVSALTAEGGSHALLSKLIYLGDERLVQSGFIRGRRVYQAGLIP